MNTPTQQIKALLADIRQDTLRYDELSAMLRQQRQAMITCDNTHLSALNDKLLVIYQQLHDSSLRRSITLKGLGLPQDAEGIARILPRLPAPLSRQVQNWWQNLENQARTCLQMNERNGLLLTTQRQSLDKLTGHLQADHFLYHG